MAFNPILETNIQPNQAVQKPSAGSAAIGLIGNLFPAREKVAPPSRSDVTDAFRQETLRAMETARQAGDTAGINSAYRNWSVQQGVGTAPEIDSAFEAYTGRSPMIATTGGDTATSTLRSSPDYTLGYELARNSNPNQSPEDLDLAGINYASSRAASTAKIESFKQRQDLTWAEAQVAYDEGFNLSVKAAREMAASINFDQVITPDEAQQFRNFFAVEMEKFDAPPGVDPTTWDTYYKQKMGTFNDLVATQLDNLLSEGPSKDMPRAMQQLFDKLIAQGKLPAGLRYSIAGGGGNQAAVDTVLQLFAANPKGSWADKIAEVSDMTFEELVVYARTFEETGVEVFQDSISTEKISAWAKQPDTTVVNSLVTDRAGISSADPMISTLAVQAIVEKVNTLGSKSLDGPLLQRTFDSAYMNALERIKAKNPALGEYFIARTAEVLKAQQSAMLNNINAVANTNGFEATMVNGKPEFRPNRDLMTPTAVAELDKYFGGDAQRAWDMMGRTVVAGGRGSGAELTPALRMSFEQIRRLGDSLNQYAAVMSTVDRIMGVKPEDAGTQASNDGSGNQLGVSVVDAGAGYTVIRMADGTTVKREGTRAWRNNNPGNIEYGDFAKSNGAIGTDGRFAIFPTVEDGRRARASLLFESSSYKNLSIGEAIARYAPSSENDTNSYIKAITSALGLPETTRLSSLGPDERAVMQNVMEGVEGFTPGKENGVQSYNTFQANPRQTMFGTSATGPFAPMAAAGPIQAPVATSGPAPVVQGTSYQPAQPVAPEATPQVSNSNPAPTPAAVVSPYDTEVQSLIDSLKNGYYKAKDDKSLQFDSVDAVEKAKAEGKIKEGDVIMLKGKPTMVW